MKRREFLKMLAALPIVSILCGAGEEQEEIGTIAPFASYDPEPVDISMAWEPTTVIAWNDTEVFGSRDGGLTWETFPGLDEWVTTGKRHNDR